MLAVTPTRQAKIYRLLISFSTIAPCKGKAENLEKSKHLSEQKGK